MGALCWRDHCSTSMITRACRASISLRAFPGGYSDLVPDFDPARPFPLTQIVADNARPVNHARRIKIVFFLAILRLGTGVVSFRGLHLRGARVMRERRLSALSFPVHFPCPLHVSGVRAEGAEPRGYWVPGGRARGAAGHHAPRGGRGQVQHLGVPGRGGQLFHDGGGAGGVLGGQLTSIARPARRRGCRRWRATRSPRRAGACRRRGPCGGCGARTATTPGAGPRPGWR